MKFDQLKLMIDNLQNQIVQGGHNQQNNNIRRDNRNSHIESNRSNQHDDNNSDANDSDDAPGGDIA